MKTAFVTGASGKTGAGVVKKFVKEGYLVACVYNTGEDRIATLKRELSDDGHENSITAYKCDLSSDSQTQEACKKALADFGHFDAVINIAGADLYKLLTDTTVKEWDDLFAVNVRSAFMVCKNFLPEMIKRKSGAIVNVSSVWGNHGASMETCYSATKSAIIGLTKALAKEVAVDGIRVNCVAPGVIDTPMNSVFDKDEINALCEMTPLGRMGRAEEVAEAVYFLCSESSSFITGETLNIDGGFCL